MSDPPCSCGDSDVYDGYAECDVHPSEPKPRHLHLVVSETANRSATTEGSD